MFDLGGVGERGRDPGEEGLVLSATLGSRTASHSGCPVAVPETGWESWHSGTAWWEAQEVSASRPMKRAEVCLPQTCADSGEESGVSWRGPPSWRLLRMNSGPALPFPFPPPTSPPKKGQKGAALVCKVRFSQCACSSVRAASELFAGGARPGRHSRGAQLTPEWPRPAGLCPSASLGSRRPKALVQLSRLPVFRAHLALLLE